MTSCLLICLGSSGLFSSAALAQRDSIENAWLRFRTGDYRMALRQATTGRTGEPYREMWWRLEAETLMVLGRYEEAHSLLTQAVRNIPYSFRLRLLLREAALYNGRSEEAERRLNEMAGQMSAGLRISREPEYLSALGEVALLLGAEPRIVLENFFKRSQQASAPAREAFLAAGRLALEKQDAALASRTFQEGLRTFPNDPDLWHGMAAAFLNGDRNRLIEYLGRALEINENHVPSRLLMAEHLIDAEDYEGATRELGIARRTNPRHPEALALLAVLAHLKNEDAAAEVLLREALSTWKENPRVHHLYGRKLSQKYRFSEGAESQRRALALAPDYTPARIQLAQDLLRLGREAEGWPLVARAHQEDAYDVTAFNLVALRERIDDFAVLTRGALRLRMAADEAEIYGERALDLLEEATNQLAEKYGFDRDTPVTVEIYPDPSDFAVRTFGMPDNPGFLGVCFGPVVTVNSPAAGRANWEAVLWHEFSHVVTLTLTHNRMPRWLSEGISVYEERLANPAWGRRMTLDFHDRIVEGRMQPISRMSAAFLQAKDSRDLSFAYFQSYLVIEYLVGTFGFDALRSLLQELREGTETNEALRRSFAPLPELDAGFTHFARQEASSLGGSFDLTRPDREGLMVPLALISPRDNYHRTLAQARRAFERGELEEARTVLVRLTSEGPFFTGENSAHDLLGRVLERLGDSEAERHAWRQVALNDGNASHAVTRLVSLAEEQGDWADVAAWSEAWLAINPLASSPWRSLLAARERLGEPVAAAIAGRSLLKLDPPDPAAIHFRIARALSETDIPGARRHVLLALEEAPRFRAAFALLADLPPAEFPEPSTIEP